MIVSGVNSPYPAVAMFLSAKSFLDDLDSSWAALVVVVGEDNIEWNRAAAGDKGEIWEPDRAEGAGTACEPDA